MEQLWNVEHKGKQFELRRKNLLHCHFVQHEFHVKLRWVEPEALLWETIM
jgi:hypothetical protein